MCLFLLLCHDSTSRTFTSGSSAASKLAVHVVCLVTLSASLELTYALPNP